jgi:beta-N-acetylhexosaminidase
MSEEVIGRVVRDTIGFSGLILTDDLSMGALSGSYSQRVSSAIKAGCDVILHCNGNMDEMVEIANTTITLSAAAMVRWYNAKSKIRHDGLKDIRGLSVEFDNLIKAIK